MRPKAEKTLRLMIEANNLLGPAPHDKYLEIIEKALARVQAETLEACELVCRNALLKIKTENKKLKFSELYARIDWDTTDKIYSKLKALRAKK